MFNFDFFYVIFLLLSLTSKKFIKLDNTTNEFRGQKPITDNFVTELLQTLLLSGNTTQKDNKHIIR